MATRYADEFRRDAVRMALTKQTGVASLFLSILVHMALGSPSPFAPTAPMLMTLRRSKNSSRRELEKCSLRREWRPYFKRSMMKSKTQILRIVDLARQGFLYL